MPNVPAEAARLIVRDALTGVYTRVALVKRLDEEVHRALRYSDPFSLLLLDLDHFKSVNDAFGHARGDSTLTELAGRLHALARHSDVLFRYGGDEFVLFLPRTTREQATVLADRLVEQIASTPFEGKPPLTLTLSVGVATLPDDGTTAEQLLARADARMYEAKRTGRARAVSTDSTREAELLLDEGARLIERLDGLDRTNRVFDTLMSAQAGALRIVGPTGSGRTRMLREVEKLAHLRGYRVARLEARKEGGQPFASIRAAIPEAAQLPSTLTDPTEIAAALRRAWSSAGLVTIITVDDLALIDRASIAVVRALVTVSRGASPVGVVNTATENDADLAPRGTPLRETIHLRPLSRDGVRAWLRSICRWEPPLDFVDWMHEQSEGLPGRVREKLLQLVEHRRLIRENDQWVLAPDYRDAGLPEPVMPSALRLGVQPAATRLVGSESALRQVLRLVRTTRLVTLCGPAGCGKSRLALEVALEVTENMRDGVALVALQPRMTAIEVATAIALRLDLPGLPGADPWIALARQIRGRKLLLILDGYEEIERNGIGIALLLAHAPELRILVTSRDPLDLLEEWVFPVDRLRVPRSAEPVQAPGFTAVQLFIERLLLANPQFRLGDAEAANVARICQLLDGSPLAIEITAAQTAVLSSRELLESLEEALELVSSYLPSAAPEQLRFRATMELAWRLLPDNGRAFMRRLSVFTSDFDESAAEQIAGAQSADLELLVARGLITRTIDNRCTIHPLVQNYAAEKIDDYPRDRATLLGAYRAHYLGLAARLGPQLRSSITARTALAALVTELPNVRRAWGLGLVETEPSQIDAARAMFDFFELQQLPADAHAFFRNAQLWRQAESIPLLHVSEPLDVVLAARLAAAQLMTGQLQEARQQLMMAGGAARTLDLREEELFCIRYEALVEASLGNHTMADEFARAAVALARRHGDAHTLVLALRDAAWAAARGPAPQRAVDLLLEAAAIETPSVGKRSVWSALLQIVQERAARGEAQFARNVLQRVLNDRAVEPDIHARAERLLAGLQSDTEASAEPVNDSALNKPIDAGA